VPTKSGPSQRREVIVRRPCPYPIARGIQCAKPAEHPGPNLDTLVCERHRGMNWSGNRNAWTHNQCEVCWFKEQPIRFPVMLRRADDDHTVDHCCFCGSPTVSRIYTREDPMSDSLICECRNDE
jgi:hypothetical protein